MLAGIAAFSCMDALGKRVASGFPVFQMLAIRSTVAVVLLLAVLAATGSLPTLHSRQPSGHALRALCGLVAFVCFFTSLRHLALADAVAISFGSPFLVTAMGHFLLHEPVSLRQWLAIAAGFAGMLVIVRPGASAAHPAAFLVLMAALAYALMMLLTRRMTRPDRPRESNQAFVFYMLLGQAAAGWLVSAGHSWRSPDARALIEMAAMGAFAIMGNYALAEAFRIGPIAAVAPFEYTALLWAVLLGRLLFGDVPTPSFWLGAAVIVGAGVYAVRAPTAAAAS